MRVKISLRTFSTLCTKRNFASPLDMVQISILWASKIRMRIDVIQSQMAQKPVLRGEVGARALRVRSVPREEVWASAGVQGAWCVYEALGWVNTKINLRDTWSKRQVGAMRPVRRSGWVWAASCSP